MRIAVAAALLFTALASAGCGSAGHAGTPTAAAAQPHHRAVAAARPLRTVSALSEATAIARRTYRLEAVGRPGRASVRRINRDAVLLSALRAHDARATRAEALRQLFLPHYHVVRLRVLRGTRSLVDVGGRFVAAGAHVELRSGGRSLGRLEASIQDVIGFVKLVHRRSGAQAVVRGSHGHVATLLRPAAHARLPLSGRTRIAGRSYAVSSFRETGFAGEPLRVWVLLPR